MLIGVPATLHFPLGLQGLGDCSMYTAADGGAVSELIGGVCVDDQGNVLGSDPDYQPLATDVATASPAPATPVVTSYPAGNTSAQDAALLSAITKAGTQALTTPYLIPGTNSVYNPATGAITTAAPTVGASTPAAVAQTTALTNSLMPIAMIGIAAVVLVMMMSRK